MIKKELYEEIILILDKDELANLFDLEPGFTAQNIEEVDGQFRFILSRRTDLSEKLEDKRKRFL